MKRALFLILAVGILLIAGFANAEPAKGAASGNVIYTNAPREIAFKASCEALQKLGYKIETKDIDNFSVKGSYRNPWAGHAPLYAQIDVSQEASGTKIVYSVEQPGAVRFLDITGRYSRCANNISNKIEEILEQGEIAFRKNKQQVAHQTKKHSSVTE